MRKESKRIHFRKLYPVIYKVDKDTWFDSGIIPKAPIIQEKFELHLDGWMLAREGYAWDGASGPAVNTGNVRRASCGHDIPYQIHQTDDICELLPSDWKEKADRLFYRLIREDGMSWIRAQWMYAAVKMFGRGRPKDLNQYGESLIEPK